MLVYLRYAEDFISLVCYGSWSGVIIRELAGIGGFGYDLIFFVFFEGKIVVELIREEKSVIFYRG